MNGGWCFFVASLFHPPTTTLCSIVLYNPTTTTYKAPVSFHSLTQQWPLLLPLLNGMFYIFSQPEPLSSSRRRSSGRTKLWTFFAACSHYNCKYLTATAAFMVDLLSFHSGHGLPTLAPRPHFPEAQQAKLYSILYDDGRYRNCELVSV